jgi:hypothetical protein
VVSVVAPDGVKRNPGSKMIKHKPVREQMFLSETDISDGIEKIKRVKTE